MSPAHSFYMNRRGTEPYARWCGRTAGAIPPPTRCMPLPRMPLPPPVRLNGQGGRIAKSDAENFREALVKYETEVLRFARVPNVPFANNRAEREIRMAKVKQKVS